MIEQHDLIHKANWDTLIILDAARYDIFKKCNTFKGKLIKVHSSASHTYSWLMRTFPGWYPWIYFSAHMWVGDKIRQHKPWNAVQHFEKVIPIWEDNFNEKLGTVHPNAVGNAVKEYFENNVMEKCIVHYIQPHGPWIGSPGWHVPWTKALHEKFGVMADYIAQEKKPDTKFFKKIYKANLKLALKSIAKYSQYFPGKVVITSDHGEMLGEKGLYLHKENFPKWADDFLRVVPWFIVER